MSTYSLLNGGEPSVGRIDVSNRSKGRGETEFQLAVGVDGCVDGGGGADAGADADM